MRRLDSLDTSFAMPRANRTEFAILGLLAAGPRSGYDIKKEVEEKLSHFWSTSYGHLYPVLETLLQRDLVERRREEQEGRPARFVYSLTADGWQALREWFERPADFARPRNELLLRVFFGEFTEPEVLVREIDRFRAQCAANLEFLRYVMRELSASPGEREKYWRLTADYGVRVMETLVAWCDDAVRALAA